MIEEPKLLTIAKDIRRPSAAQIAAFKDIPTGFVVDAMFGAGQMSPEIQPLRGMEGKRISGAAVTVDCGPADILALLGSLNFVEAGSFVVSSFGGYQGCAAAGDRVAAMMRNCGAVGFVTDGPMRDHDGLMEVGLPCWCTGLNPGSPFAKGPGKIGLPVTVGGAHVETGDMIVADCDGVVVVPFAKIDEVITNLKDVIAAEEALDRQLASDVKFPEEFRAMIEGDDVTWV